MNPSDLIEVYGDLGAYYRLLHLAEHEHLSSPSLSQEYLQSLLDLSISQDKLYFYVHTKEVIARLYGGSGCPLRLISAEELKDWETRTREQVIALESTLSQAKNQGNRELIKASVDELGNFYYTRGDPNSALKAYIRSRDILTTNDEIFQHAITMSKCSYFHKNFAYSLNQANKALNSGTASIKNRAVGQAMTGLCFLKNRDYHSAAMHFSKLTTAFKGELSNICTLKDLLCYTVISTLASSERDDVKHNLIDNQDFSELIEEESFLRDILESFVACQFTSFIGKVAILAKNLEYDFNVGFAVNDMLNNIKNRSVAEYLKPFKRVRIQNVAQSFSDSPEDMERRLANLIMDNKVQGRIDSHNKIFQAKYSNEKLQSFQEALSSGRKIVRNNEIILIRASMIQQGLILRPK